MPELPEMQALAERLDDLLAGAIFSGLTVMQFSALKTASPAPEGLAGKALASVSRRGKYLVFDFGGPRLMIHLMQGGRVDIEEPPKATRAKAAVARLRFESRPAVLIKEFGTQRKAGVWMVEPGAEGPLSGLGPEPSTPEFAELVRSGEDGRRLHTFLRDQRTVAGIGRGYSDEILHEAMLSPFASLKSLKDAERERLLSSVTTVLERGLLMERKRKGGLPNKLEGRFVIHGHSGEPCPRCRDELRRVSFEGYEIVYCAPCQTRGKILADRRLSRLIR
jgi:formamidopyrimidine-DNA glycosylase